MEELKQNLIAVINNSQVNIEGVYYITKDLYREIEMTYNNYLRQKAEESKKKAEENEANNKKEK